jgi:hypothetical protein
MSEYGLSVASQMTREQANLGWIYKNGFGVWVFLQSHEQWYLVYDTFSGRRAGRNNDMMSLSNFLDRTGLV